MYHFNFESSYNTNSTESHRPTKKIDTEQCCEIIINQRHSRGIHKRQLKLSKTKREQKSIVDWVLLRNGPAMWMIYEDTENSWYNAIVTDEKKLSWILGRS